MTNTLKKKAKKVVKAIEQADNRPKPIPDEAWLSLGNTLVNLAVTGRKDAGIAKGTYLWYCGGSESGKTWFALQCLAEASINPEFDGYNLVYDSPENGALMEVAEYFGDALCERLLSPKFTSIWDNDGSTTVQDFYYNLDDIIKAGKPFIYVLDSMDALDEAADEGKFQEMKDARDSDKEVSGSYGMGKAKVNSTHIKRVVSALAKTGSILIVISQVRDKIGRLPFPQETVAGGRALRFYAHVQLWTKVTGDITKDYAGKKREVGKTVQIDVQKNRMSGWSGKVSVPFARKFGFDETGACVDWLIDEGVWTKKGSTINASDLNLKLPREKLVATIEGKNLEGKLASLVQYHWRQIDEASRLKRKKRY